MEWRLEQININTNPSTSDDQQSITDINTASTQRTATYLNSAKKKTQPEACLGKNETNPT